jgi:hypothetical protein
MPTPFMQNRWGGARFYQEPWPRFLYHGAPGIRGRPIVNLPKRAEYRTGGPRRKKTRELWLEDKILGVGEVWTVGFPPPLHVIPSSNVCLLRSCAALTCNTFDRPLPAPPSTPVNEKCQHPWALLVPRLNEVWINWSHHIIVHADRPVCSLEFYSHTCT